MALDRHLPSNIVLNIYFITFYKNLMDKQRIYCWPGMNADGIVASYPAASPGRRTMQCTTDWLLLSMYVNCRVQGLHPPTGMA